MKHPVRDRLLLIVLALIALCAAAAGVALVMGYTSLEPVIALLGRVNNNIGMSIKIKAAVAGVSALFVLLALMLVGVTLPSRKKRSSNYAIQHNENGMVRISVKALEALVHKCLSQHAELKVVTSSLFSDEESIRVDVHVTLQSDISMPLAISALQKQIKKYLEACSGVTVQEVRVFVDGTTPATEETMRSPYAIPMGLLGIETEALPANAQKEAPVSADAADPEMIIIEEEDVCQEPEAEEEEPAQQEADEEEAAGETSEQTQAEEAQEVEA